MARLMVVCVAVALLSLLASIPAFAKGPTVKLTITGPGLPEPIELTDEDAVSAGVWSGTFMVRERGMADAPASELPRYTVQFHVKLPRTDEVRMMYVVYYVWDAVTRRALVQIPAVEDQWYPLNVSTIGRCCQGRWFYAADRWGETIKAALTQTR
jgi:hypothetical protein